MLIRQFYGWPIISGLAGGGSVEPRAAVDVDGLAGDEAAVVADQKQAGGGDLVHHPLTAQGNPGGTRHMAPIPFGIVSPGIDTAWGDHIGADVLPRKLDSQRASEPDQAHLRRRDVSASAAAGECAFAGEEQDAPIAVGDHRGDDRSRAIHRPVEDDAPDLLPILHRHLGEELVRPDRRLVDQDVDAPEFRERPRPAPATGSASAWLLRALPTRWAPSPASFNTVARPMLRPEPVTSATFPSSFPMSNPPGDL